MTNREWLNSLTEEDFANTLYEYDDNIECKCCVAYSIDTACFNHCKEGFIAWLKQEHKDEQN